MVVELLYSCSGPHQRDARCRKPLFPTQDRRISCVEPVLAFQFSWIWVGAQFSTGCGFGHPGGLTDFRLSAIALDALIRLRAASHLLSPFPRGPRVRRLPSEVLVPSFPGAAGSQASFREVCSLSPRGPRVRRLLPGSLSLPNG